MTLPTEEGTWLTGWEVSVPPDSFPEVLDLFREGSVDSSPSKWQVMAELTISRKTGSPIRVDVFKTGRDRCQFKIDGTYYWGRNERQVTDLLKQFAKRPPRRGP
jgi:hypothetical protein